ncbi:hypothetical protein BDV95DRAFT_590510 [Massariosphaeria phaeospora]|uniref:Uncharacterized protein n=1 Tax=Massariosphaeria phaeospora TaxID=100035 RepID=A0A7C8MT85_9PLEO|nr:hypothetical protein BDV95DRAFT_590510 [Massariosphaeria phaeospora]
MGPWIGAGELVVYCSGSSAGWAWVLSLFGNKVVPFTWNGENVGSLRPFTENRRSSIAILSIPRAHRVCGVARSGRSEKVHGLAMLSRDSSKEGLSSGTCSPMPGRRPATRSVWPRTKVRNFNSRGRHWLDYPSTCASIRVD